MSVKDDILSRALNWMLDGCPEKKKKILHNFRIIIHNVMRYQFIQIAFFGGKIVIIPSAGQYRVLEE